MRSGTTNNGRQSARIAQKVAAAQARSQKKGKTSPFTAIKIDEILQGEEIVRYEQFSQAWNRRTPAQIEDTGLGWQATLKRFLPLLAIASETDREETFDAVADASRGMPPHEAEGWSAVTRSNYWSAFLMAAESIGAQ